MTVGKIINALASDIKDDIGSNWFGGFGDTDSRLDDLMIIAKTIHDNVLLKQIKKAKNDLFYGNINKVINDLNNLVVEAK